MDQTTIFDKILNKEIPANIIHDDDLCIAFLDINPQAEFHALVIPKKKDNLDRLTNAQDKDKNLLGHLMFVASQLPKKNGFEDCRFVVNNGPLGGQEVYHLHIHVLATKSKQFGFPPGTSK